MSFWLAVKAQTLASDCGAWAFDGCVMISNKASDKTIRGRKSCRAFMATNLPCAARKAGASGVFDGVQVLSFPGG
jgi:hypothetical protein